MSDLPTTISDGDSGHEAHHEALHTRYNQGGPIVVTFEFAFDTPGLVGDPTDPTAGVLVATLPQFAVPLFAGLALTEVFDGSGPNGYFGPPGDLFHGPVDLTTLGGDVGHGRTAFISTGDMVMDEVFYAAATPIRLCVDDGAGGDPGSSQGAGFLKLVYT